MRIIEKLSLLFDWLFSDAVRPVEIISGLNLLAWAHMLFKHPALLERGPYIGFQSLGAEVWTVLLLSVGLGQLASVFPACSVRYRIATMSMACGIWMMVAVNCMTTPIQSTADVSYIILSMFCVLSGVYLGWKKP